MLKKASWSLRRCIKLWDIWLTDSHAISTATEKEMSFSAIFLPNVSLLDFFVRGGYFLNLIMYWHRNVLPIYLVIGSYTSIFSPQTLNQRHHGRCFSGKTATVGPTSMACCCCHHLVLFCKIHASTYLVLQPDLLCWPCQSYLAGCMPPSSATPVLWLAMNLTNDWFWTVQNQHVCNYLV